MLEGQLKIACDWPAQSPWQFCPKGSPYRFETLFDFMLYAKCLYVIKNWNQIWFQKLNLLGGIPQMT